MDSRKLKRVVAAAALASACASSPPPRTADRGRADERAYLAARREERSCQALQASAEREMAAGNHAATLDTTELLIAYCPAQHLRAVEKTMVMLSSTRVRAATSFGRSVRLRIKPPSDPEYRLFSLGVYADGQLGANDLPPGNHRIDVDMHLWKSVRAGPGEMLRVQSATMITIDETNPVVLDVALEPQPGSPVPFALKLTPVPPEASANASALGEAGYRRLSSVSGDEVPFPRAPEPLSRAGFSATLELEICIDGAGRVNRVTPLSWAHPRYLGAYIDGLRAWNLRAVQGGGAPFCTAWRQTLEPSSATGAL